jgi:hypothetical protein
MRQVFVSWIQCQYSLYLLINTFAKSDVKK